MTRSVRDAARVLLLSPSDKLLLTQTDEGYWYPVGGGIEPGESIEHAAMREIAEETGIAEAELGPVVWRSEVELVRLGTPTLQMEHFIVARTLQEEVTTEHVSEDERPLVRRLAWFSLEEVINCPDTIFPLRLGEFLPDILAGNYPPRPLDIGPLED